MPLQYAEKIMRRDREWRGQRRSPDATSLSTTCRETMVSDASTGYNLGSRATRGCWARYRLQVAMATAVMLGGCLGGRGSLDGKVIDVANGATPVPGTILVLTRSRPAGWATDAT